jgi:hypothetical protein
VADIVVLGLYNDICGGLAFIKIAEEMLTLALELFPLARIHSNQELNHSGAFQGWSGAEKEITQLDPNLCCVLYYLRGKRDSPHQAGVFTRGEGIREFVIATKWIQYDYKQTNLCRYVAISPRRMD